MSMSVTVWVRTCHTVATLRMRSGDTGRLSVMTAGLLNIETSSGCPEAAVTRQDAQPICFLHMTGDAGTKLPGALRNVVWAQCLSSAASL